MEIRRSTTAEGLPRIDWVQKETAITPFYYSTGFIVALCFIAAFLLAIPITYSIDVWSNPEWQQGNPILWFMCLWPLTAVIALPLAFSAERFVKRKLKFVEIGKTGLMKVDVPCCMFIEKTPKNILQIHYAAPALDLKQRPIEKRMKRFDAHALVGFSIESAARWFSYSGSGIPESHIIMAQLKDGGIEIVAFDCQTLFSLTQLHSVMQKAFNADQFSNNQRPAAGQAEPTPKAPIVPRSAYDDGDVI